MMEELPKFPKAAGSVLALSIAEVILALGGFAANFYNIFYGILVSDERIPMIQALALVISIPVFGTQLVCGGRFMLACVRIFPGQRNSAFFDEGGMPLCALGICQLWALVGSGMCLFAMVYAWFYQVGHAANQPVLFAQPKLEAWAAIQQAFQADFPGQMVMLAAVLLQIASVIVVVFIIRQSKSVRKELKSADRNSDDLHSSSEEYKLIAFVKEHNGPPPPYSDGKMVMTV
ncbi:uncharacterized protein LOC129593193 [Paramacrobiotus metropolitanus]|uniref:uncharacterized protein LOC129593193 n=1 Tax=Paramacrobiotus metropolitanus TaxID=2943436 RepID=UPI002445D1CA|nr:uncharacterized protein LOC129593193 [Paramacrobiotus metropolitanus]